MSSPHVSCESCPQMISRVHFLVGTSHMFSVSFSQRLLLSNNQIQQQIGKYFFMCEWVCVCGGCLSVCPSNRTYPSYKESLKRGWRDESIVKSTYWFSEDQEGFNSQKPHGPTQPLTPVPKEHMPSFGLWGYCKHGTHTSKQGHIHTHINLKNKKNHLRKKIKNGNIL